MAYVKTVFVNDSTPAISAEELNKMGDGIFNNDAQITELNDMVGNIVEYNIGEAIELYSTLSDTQAYYNSAYTLLGLRSNNSFICKVYRVEKDKTYYVYGKGKATENYPDAVLAENYITSGTTTYFDVVQYDNAEYDYHTTLIKAKKDGYIYVNIASWQSSNVGLYEANFALKENDYPLYLHRNGDLVEIMSKYSEEKDAIYMFNKVGANNIMQIAGMDSIVNKSQHCSGNFDATRTNLISPVTDWMSPYKVIAVNNADGDGSGKGVNGYYTGGFHGYNGDATGSATGSTTSYKLFADDVEITSTADKVYSVKNKVVLIVTNQIQGNNTTKSDGSGRAILKEEIRYEITPNRIDITNTISALEDIIISQYYGLQMYLDWHGGFSGFTYYGDSIKSYDFTADTSYTEDIDYFVGGTSANVNRIHCQLDKKGIGRHQYIAQGNITARSITGRKVYNNLVANQNNLPLSSGDSVFISGHYSFASGYIPD